MQDAFPETLVSGLTPPAKLNFSVMSETNLLKGAADLSASVALLRFTGEDREAFLQGQLTNDVRHLTSDSLMTAGWCSPKGRLLAVFQLYKDNDAVYAFSARETLDATVKRLRMYILRSKVKVEEVKDLTVAGIVGDVPSDLPTVKCFTQTSGSPEALDALGLTSGRALALVKADTELTGSAEAYWAATAAAGVPFIVSATSDKFVPQAVNLECIGGVSFNKGCYTGQEIVSRVEHIGKTARRAALLPAVRHFPQEATSPMPAAPLPAPWCFQRPQAPRPQCLRRSQPTKPLTHTERTRRCSRLFPFPTVIPAAISNHGRHSHQYPGRN